MASSSSKPSFDQKDIMAIMDLFAGKCTKEIIFKFLIHEDAFCLGPSFSPEISAEALHPWIHSSQSIQGITFSSDPNPFLMWPTHSALSQHLAHIECFSALMGQYSSWVRRQHSTKEAKAVVEKRFEGLRHV